MFAGRYIFNKGYIDVGSLSVITPKTISNAGSPKT